MNIWIMDGLQMKICGRESAIALTSEKQSLLEFTPSNDLVKYNL